MIPVISIVEYFWRWPQCLRSFDLFLYVKPLILGPLDSPTIRAVTAAAPSWAGVAKHAVAVDQHHGPQRDLVAGEPLDVEPVALGDAVLLTAGVDDCVHARCLFGMLLGTGKG